MNTEEIGNSNLVETLRSNIESVVKEELKN